MVQKWSKLACAPIYGNRAMGRNSVNFSPISKRKLSSCSGHRDLQVEYAQAWFWAIFKNSNYRAQIWARAPRGLGWVPKSQNPPKSSVTGWWFLVNQYLDNDFSKKFRLVPPPHSGALVKAIMSFVPPYPWVCIKWSQHT